MKKRNLVLLCDNYPLSAGEFFIDDEIKVVATNFEKVYVFIYEQKRTNLNRHVPENLEVIIYDGKINGWNKTRRLFSLFSILFLNEFYSAITKYKIRFSVKLMKIIYMDIVRSSILIKQLNEVIKIKNLSLEETIFYSYWHDYKSLALARLCKKNRNFKGIARAHRWDVYFYANTPSYLPFKKFIISNLSKTFAISEDGKSEFEKLLCKKLDDKIIISKLGKFNHQKPKIENETDSFLFCSCSSIIPVKRVALIIDLISKIKVDKTIKWVHFGDGYLMNEIEQIAKIRLLDISFELKGIIPNNEILEYYRDNFVDLFINLSESEGIPVSIMEALSAGIPVLATDVGGIKEAINMKHGFLIPKDVDVSETATVIENFLKSKKENQLQYRINAYDYWKKNYEAENNYSLFVNYLNEIN